MDLTGQVFGRLIALALDGDGRPARWLCRCSCGEQRSVAAGQLRSGKARSCGCLRREATAGRNRRRVWPKKPPRVAVSVTHAPWREEAVRLRAAGWTFAAIAGVVGVSKARVHQVLARRIASV